MPYIYTRINVKKDYIDFTKINIYNNISFYYVLKWLFVQNDLNCDF